MSQYSYRREAIQRKIGKLRSNCTVTFSKGTWHHIKFWERKGASRGVIQQFEPHERSPCDPNCGERTKETLHQGKMPAELHGSWRRVSFKLKNMDKSYVLLTCRRLVSRETISLAITAVVAFLDFRRVSCSLEHESCWFTMCIDERILTLLALSKRVPVLPMNSSVGRRTWPCPSL